MAPWCLVRQGGLARGLSWAALGRRLEAGEWGQPPWQPLETGPLARL